MLTLENGRTHPIVAPQIAERRFAQRVVTRQQFLDPARHKTRHRRHRRDRMALRQKPDRLVVPRRARVLTGSITSRQIFDAQVVFDMGHGSPPRFMAAYANRFDPKSHSAIPPPAATAGGTKFKRCALINLSASIEGGMQAKPVADDDN